MVKHSLWTTPAKLHLSKPTLAPGEHQAASTWDTGGSRRPWGRGLATDTTGPRRS